MDSQGSTYSVEQYNLLRKCSSNKDVSEWNNWRRENPKEAVKLEGADVSSFELSGVNLNSANLENADLENACLRKAHLFNATMRGANLRNANLEEAYIIEAALDSCVVTRARFSGSSLLRVRATNSVFDYSDFTRSGIEVSEFADCSFIDVDFSHANFSDPLGRKTTFKACNFGGSTFVESMACKTDFRHSTFTDVKFRNADLSGSNFWYAQYEIQGILEARQLSHTRFLLDNYSDYLLFKGEDIFFCNKEQYNMLLECSKNRDLSKWNEWNPHTGLMAGRRIHLAGASFKEFFLEKARLLNADLRGSEFFNTNLKGACLDYADLEEADMNYNPRFDYASLRMAKLRKASCGSAIFRNAHLFKVDLEGADLGCADFAGALLQRANLKNTKCQLAANFQGANMREVNLQDANLYKCNLAGTDFRRATVDSSTSMYQCQIDKNTDFRCVALDSIGIDATTKRLLEVNIRRMNWNDWYWNTTWPDQKRLLIKGSNTKETIIMTTRSISRGFATLPMRFFWWIADYGASSRNLIYTFCCILVLFSMLYYHNSKGIVNLESRKGLSSMKPSRLHLVVRSVYFSTVTMTTLGYGNIHPKAESKGMQIAVICQVVLSYVLLGAIITYLGILFTSGGPFLIYSYPHSGPPQTRDREGTG